MDLGFTWKWLVPTLIQKQFFESVDVFADLGLRQFLFSTFALLHIWESLVKLWYQYIFTDSPKFQNFPRVFVILEGYFKTLTFVFFLEYISLLWETYPSYLVQPNVTFLDFVTQRRIQNILRWSLCDGWKPLTIIAKSFILDVQLSSECVISFRTFNPVMAGGNKRSYLNRPAGFSCRFVKYVWPFVITRN